MPKSTQHAGTLASNLKSKHQSAKHESTFQRTGQTGRADQAPGGNLGKGFGKQKQKQAKYGFKPDKQAAPLVGKGPVHTSAYQRSGGVIG